jgi:flagellar M-ring protein FliF
MISLARTVGVVLIALIALFLAYRSARKSTMNRYPVAVPIETPPGPSPTAIADATEAINALVEAIPISAADKERLAIESQIGDMIDRQPEEVAVMLRGWLADRRS